MGLLEEDLYHCTTKLFEIIYPLSINEYKQRSLERRASYDYCLQIIEDIYKIIGNIIKNVGVEEIHSEKRKRFEQAFKLKLIPGDVKETLCYLTLYRNKKTHEGEIVNRNLTMYEKLIDYICIGYFMYRISLYLEFALFSKFKIAKSNDTLIIIDKVFLKREIENSTVNKDSINAIKEKIDNLKVFKIYRYDANEILEQITNIKK